jgi:hypothetical protein
MRIVINEGKIRCSRNRQPAIVNGVLDIWRPTHDFLLLSYPSTRAMTNTRHLLTMHTTLPDESDHGHCHFHRAKVLSKQVLGKCNLANFSLVTFNYSNVYLFKAGSSTCSKSAMSGDKTVTVIISAKRHNKRVNKANPAYRFSQFGNTFILAFQPKRVFARVYFF